MLSDIAAFLGCTSFVMFWPLWCPVALVYLYLASRQKRDYAYVAFLMFWPLYHPLAFCLFVPRLKGQMYLCKYFSNDIIERAIIGYCLSELSCSSHSPLWYAQLLEYPNMARKWLNIHNFVVFFLCLYFELYLTVYKKRKIIGSDSHAVTIRLHFSYSRLLQIDQKYNFHVVGIQRDSAALTRLLKA